MSGSLPVTDPAGDLIAEDLACRRGERLIFAGVSFRLPAGGALVLTGANGSGKTSLLRLLAGLIGAAAGRLAWGSAPLADDVAGHRARLHYVGHQDGVKPGLTPRETLAFWAALRGVDVRRRAPLLDAALAAFALERVADWPCRW
ncbi:MAG TPA: ATP-binding cassette domain-containing protein, partial [Stellaceae bacterium]|nr:ATP-binding cassette domain-containing protein [Stellaceae bacterium]